ncbi:MAG TPA: bifunctional DNA primase/polymerase [Tepidisphaeraceae bacterium]|jgi:hypothetical protein|nr:bifunctional DNA primase/polymerase [Tepidisphaeraceae bacterium]
MEANHGPNRIYDAALGYLRRGWLVVPVPYAKKACKRKGWADFRLDEAGVRKAFKARKNVGVLLGEPSGGLTDVDLDCAEALALADAFLPATDCIFGRPGKPRSHRLYVCQQVPHAKAFKGGAGKEATMLVEVRSTRQLTIFPPSIHEGTGERIAFDRNGEPGRVEGRRLVQAVGKVAAAALLVRHWPKEAGCRQNIALALSGGLMREGWAMEDVGAFIGAVARAANDEEAGKRARAAEDTFKRQRAAASSTGWPMVAGLVDAKLIDRVREFLDFNVGYRVPTGTSWQASGTQILRYSDAQIHKDAQGYKELSVVPCCEPSISSAITERMAVMRADLDAGRPPTLALAEYVAAAVECHWHHRNAGKGGKWTTPLWGLIRDLKAHPDLKGRDSMTVIDFVERVFKLWPTEGDDPWRHWTDEAADDAREQIAFAWARIRYIPGCGPLDEAVELARKHPLEIPPAHRLTPDFERFLSVAGWLQASVGDNAILLPCHKVSVAMFGDDSKHQNVARWIGIAAGQGYLHRLRRGHYGAGVHPSKRTADDFRFNVAFFTELKEAMEPHAPFAPTCQAHVPDSLEAT